MRRLKTGFHHNQQLSETLGYEHCSTLPLAQVRISSPKDLNRASLVAQWQRICLSVQETWVQSLGREDPWRKKWQSTAVFLPGTSHGQRSQAGCSPWGRRVRLDLVTAQQDLNQESTWRLSAALYGQAFYQCPDLINKGGVLFNRTPWITFNALIPIEFL